MHKIVTGRRDDFDDPAPGGRPVGLPEPGRVASTTGSRTATPRRSSQLRPRPGHRPAPAAARTTAGSSRCIGDGSMTGGMAFEGLNNLGHSGREAIIVLNDNGRSYAPDGRRGWARACRSSARQPRVPAPAAPGSSACSRELPVVGDRTSSGASTAPRPRSARCSSRRRSSRPRRPLHRARSTATTSPASRRRSATPPSSTARSSCTCSPRRAGATRRPRTTRSSACTTSGRASKPGGVHRRLHRGAHQGGRGRGPSSWPSPRPCPTPPACCRSASASPTASSTSASPSSTPSPSAAGMAMGGLRPVVAIYSTFLTRAFDQVNLDVGLHGQPVRLLPRPRRHHRRRRRVAPRRARHGAADEGAGHDDVRAVVVPGARGRCCTTRSSIADGPAAIRWLEDGRPRGRRATRSARACTRRKVRDGRATSASSASARCSTPPSDGRRRSRPTGIAVTVWDPRVVKPLDPDDARRRRPAPRSWSPSRTACATAASARRSPTRSPKLARPVDGPRVRVLGVPSAYIPHGKPDAILADLGLDADGIVDEVTAWVRSAVGLHALTT